VSGVGDIDGFRHDDLEVSPAQGSFPGPRFGNTESLAFAAKKPSILARSGTGGTSTHAAISQDGGKTWHLLPTEPADTDGGAGTIALSANGKIIVWTPRRGAPSFTVDDGNHWTNCLGTSPKLRVIADPVNPSRFYAFDAQSWKILTSTNGASSFLETAAAFPQTNGPSEAVLSATPGLEGDLWLALGENGLYHSTDGGTSFTKADAVQNERNFPHCIWPEPAAASRDCFAPWTRAQPGRTSTTNNINSAASARSRAIRGFLDGSILRPAGAASFMATRGENDGIKRILTAVLAAFGLTCLAGQYTNFAVAVYIPIGLVQKGSPRMNFAP
jgi:hypothetical protein